jgi:hypothetical protein
VTRSGSRYVSTASPHLNAAPTVVSAILTADQAGPLTRPVTITTAGAVLPVWPLAKR